MRQGRRAPERGTRARRALDLLTPLRIALLMNREDRRAVLAVARVRRQIATAVGTIVAALRRRGRLFFVGAGTSGRPGVLQAPEGPPAFRTPPRLVQAIIAGGHAAVLPSRQGAE